MNEDRVKKTKLKITKLAQERNKSSPGRHWWRYGAEGRSDRMSNHDPFPEITFWCVSIDAT